MAGDDVAIRIRLLDAARAATDARRVAAGIKQIGQDSTRAGMAARAMGTAVSSATSMAGRGLRSLASASRYAALGIVGIAGAGVKMGLSFNAQVESARLRFRLFTDDVDGLTKAVSRIDMSSAFDLGTLTDAAAMLGNSGVKDVPGLLQAAVNAAAAGGKGAEGLQSIVIALSQIQSKGKLSQEEVNQLNEAGAPGAQRVIQKAFSLTKEELGNLGAEGLSAKKALAALQADWTSGRMASAAKAQTKTLGGQWDLLTGNVQKMSGALTMGLAGALSKDVIPAANRATSQITAIFGRDGLSNEEKLRQARQVIDRELGPIWDDVKQALDDADIPEHLGSAIGDAVPFMIDGAVQAAPKVAEAFVDAWVESGPWVKILTVLGLAGKLKTLTGVGGGKGSALGSLLGKGSSPANPMWVAVTNKGGIPGVSGPGGSKPGSKIGSPIVSGLKTGAKLALPAAAIWGLTDFINSQPTNRPHMDALDPETQAQIRLADRTNMVGRGGTGAGGQALYERATENIPIINHVSSTVDLVVNGAVLGRAVTVQKAKANARRAGRGPQGLPG